MYTYGDQKKKPSTRKNVTYDDLQVLVDAIVAAEDSRFFEHNGFDLPHIVKAALSSKKRECTGGGSVTQQLIRKHISLMLRTYSRKFS